MRLNLWRNGIVMAGLAAAVAGCTCHCGQEDLPVGPWQIARPRLSADRVGPVTSVESFGAVSDGKTVATKELQAALDACSKGGGGVMRFPAGTYLTGSLVIGSNTTVRLEKGATITGTGNLADYPVIPGRWEGATTPTHRALLSAEGAEHVAILGEGTIVGNAAVAFPRPARIVKGEVAVRPRGDATRGATVLEFSHCNDVRVESVTLRQSGVWTTHPVFCRDVLFRGVTFETNGTNSDGVDVDSSARVWIDHCSFVNGDDAIALKSGKGDEGRKSPPTEDVLITDCAFHRNSFAAIAFGSECAGGVRRVQIERCTFDAGMPYALRMKTANGRGGYIEQVRARDLKSSAQRFMQVIMNVNHPDPEPLEGAAGITTMADFDIEHVTLAGGVFLDITGDPQKPIAGLHVKGVTGTCSRAMTIANAQGVELADIAVTGFSGPRLSAYRVEGTGLEGAVQLSAQPGATAPDRAPATQR